MDISSILDLLNSSACFYTLYINGIYYTTEPKDIYLDIL